jgi:hypothetical protein
MRNRPSWMFVFTRAALSLSIMYLWVVKGWGGEVSESLAEWG